MTQADRPTGTPPPGGITGAVFDRFTDTDPHRPRLVWYGGAPGGGRTELSTASLTNWAAKTAGFLLDELGAAPGRLVLWRVRRSWQGLPLLLGCWWAGLVVTDDESSVDAVVAFVDEGDESDADEVVVASSHPFGLAIPDLPPLYRNVADAILPQADRFAPRGPGPATDAAAIITASGPLSVGDVLGLVDRAALAVGRGAVLLSTAEPDLPTGVCAGALAVWAAGGTLVQVGPGRAADEVARIGADERASVTLGVDVDGLPRVG